MKLPCHRIASLTICLLAASAAGAAAQSKSFGEREYINSCAVCHGEKGKGDGFFASALKKDVSDLTVLAKNNKGVFPFKRLYEVIDGRENIKSHGSRDMPVWGQEYRAEGSDKWIGPMGTGFTERDAEVMIRARILALIEYISTLQVK